MSLVLGSIGWGLVATGAVSHLWHHDRMRDLLARHFDRESLAGFLLVGIEVVLAALLGVAVLVDSSLTPVAGLATAVLGIGFAVWVLRLILSGSDLPCACSFSPAPPSWWSLLRAAAVCLSGLFVFVDWGTIAAFDRVSALLSGAAMAVAIYVLPDALGWPTVSRAQLARLDSHAPR